MCIPKSVLVFLVNINYSIFQFLLFSDGQKMSKRLKNYPDPVAVVNKFGADALRLVVIVCFSFL